jgi:hypothetical protein
MCFFMIEVSEKLAYVENGRIFFSTASAEIHQTPTPIIYVKKQSNWQ